MKPGEKVLSNMVLANGLHRMEFIRFGAPVAIDALAEELVPEVAQETWTWHEWVEDPKGLCCHHAYLYWRERGLVDFSLVINAMGERATGRSPLQKIPNVGILYWIAPGERVSFAADVAATVHQRMLGVMPSTAWVRELPAKAPKRIEVGEGKDHAWLDVCAGDWVPAGYVVVGKPEPVSKPATAAGEGESQDKEEK